MCAILCALTMSADAASVVPRSSSTATRPKTTTRTNNAATRMPTLSVRAESAATPTTTSDTTQPDSTTTTDNNTDTGTDNTPEPETYIIEDKSSQFDTTLTKTATSGATDASSDSLADMIKRQRAALDAKDAAATANTVAYSGQNVCDTGLRECMAEKCGADFTDCALDGDTLWGDKMDACRRNLPCTGQEYQLFTKEIKADRDMNARLASYNEILNCGNEYNDCIISQCGTTFGKCLGKTAGDTAIAKCDAIAKKCIQADSGLAARAMEAFAVLRVDAEKQVAADEKRLYALRDEMRNQCEHLGAMFDERSLDCVYTINFYAGNATTPYASKKGYAGSTFDCTQNWFGVDITTFKENAYRYTRSQKSATSGLMGAGVGTAVGAVTSGAIGRAIDRQKAENAVKDAQEQHNKTFSKPENQQDNKPADNSSTETPDTPIPADGNTNTTPAAQTALESTSAPTAPKQPEQTTSEENDGYQQVLGSGSTTTTIIDSTADDIPTHDGDDGRNLNSDTTENPQNYLTKHFPGKKIDETDIANIKKFIAMADKYDTKPIEVKISQDRAINNQINYDVFFTALDEQASNLSTAKNRDTGTKRCTEMANTISRNITFLHSSEKFDYQTAQNVIHHGCSYAITYTTNA